MEDGGLGSNATEQGDLNRDPLHCSIYGDSLSSIKDDDNLLFGYININGLQEERWKVKNSCLFTQLKKYYFDIIGLSEINLHWPLVNPADSWEEQSSGRWEQQHLVVTCNMMDNINKAWQPGGCELAVVATDDKTQAHDAHAHPTTRGRQTN